MKQSQMDGHLKHKSHEIWVARAAGLSAFMIALSPTTGSGGQYDCSEVARVFLSGATGSDGFIPLHAPVTGIDDFDLWASLGVFGPDGLMLKLLHGLHFGGVAVMFANFFGYFSFFVFTRQNSTTSLSALQEGTRKKRRNFWYRSLGTAIFAVILTLGVKSAVISRFLSAADEMHYWRSGMPGI
mgnify:CR=1 FL=1